MTHMDDEDGYLFEFTPVPLKAEEGKPVPDFLLERVDPEKIILTKKEYRGEVYYVGKPFYVR